MMFLRPFVEKRTARSWVNDSPATATLTQSAAWAVAESAQIIAVAAKPSFKERICPSEDDLSQSGS
jgi:hypothetical protein